MLYYDHHFCFSTSTTTFFSSLPFLPLHFYFCLPTTHWCNAILVLSWINQLEYPPVLFHFILHTFYFFTTPFEFFHSFDVGTGVIRKVSSFYSCGDPGGVIVSTMNSGRYARILLIQVVFRMGTHNLAIKGGPDLFNDSDSQSYGSDTGWSEGARHPTGGGGINLELTALSYKCKWTPTKLRGQEWGVMTWQLKQNIDGFQPHQR